MKHRVVVVGGGFGGLQAAKALTRLPVDVILIDERNFHLFQPLLYQVATGGLSPGDIASPIRSVVRKQKRVSVLMTKAKGLDVQSKEVVTDHGEVPYDTLIIATGVRHSYFGNDGWEEIAPGLKTIEDALRIRAKVLSAFESAELEDDPARRAALLSFVIVGAGPTGVELAGALGELSRRTLRGDFRRIDPALATIYLVEGDSRVLPTFDARLSVRARRSLERLGVTVLNESRVTDIADGEVTISAQGESRTLRSENVFWAAGVEACGFSLAVAEATDAKTDSAGRIAVLENLTVDGHDDIFVIGDLASFPTPLPGVAQVAMQMGRHVARVLSHRFKGRAEPSFRYRDYGSLAVIGRNSAVGKIGRFMVAGIFGWVAWAFIHIMQIVGFDNRLVIAVQWAYSYVTYNKGARLIGEETRRR